MSNEMVAIFCFAFGFAVILGFIGRELSRIADALEERNKQTFKDK